MFRELRLSLASCMLTLMTVSADEWLSMKNKECFYKNDTEKLPNGTLDDFKAEADKNGFVAFVVWEGKAYFRSGTAEECLKHLHEPPHENEVTLYYKGQLIPKPTTTLTATTKPTTTLTATATTMENLPDIMNEMMKHRATKPVDLTHGSRYDAAESKLKTVVGEYSMTDADKKTEQPTKHRKLCCRVALAAAGQLSGRSGARAQALGLVWACREAHKIPRGRDRDLQHDFRRRRGCGWLWYRLAAVREAFAHARKVPE